MAMSVPAGLLTGSTNFRPVKSYKAADGRTLRPNIIYRSGELSRLTEADLDIIAGLDIKLICDLRSAREQAEFISRWPATSGPVKLELPDRDDSDAGPHKIFEQISQHPGEIGGLKVMDMLYRRKPRAFAKGLNLLFTTILQGDALPLLIHCHAGKDRTGFLTAMLLTAIGISKTNVIDDYETTAIYFPVEREIRAITAWAKRSFGHDIDEAAARPLVDARRDYLEAAFEEIENGWGGADAYLRDAVGLTPTMKTQLADLLLH
jgi:protein-tyrosine phosphatase